MKPLILSLLLLVISACSTVNEERSGLDLQAADSVQFLRPYELSRTDVSFVSLGDVIGESCQTQFWHAQPTQEQALLRLKVAAAEMGGNRVVLKACQQTDSSACHARWVCTGHAYQEQPLR